MGILKGRGSFRNWVNGGRRMLFRLGEEGGIDAKIRLAGVQIGLKGRVGGNKK